MTSRAAAVNPDWHLQVPLQESAPSSAHNVPDGRGTQANAPLLAELPSRAPHANPTAIAEGAQTALYFDRIGYCPPAVDAGDRQVQLAGCRVPAGLVLTELLTQIGASALSFDVDRTQRALGLLDEFLQAIDQPKMVERRQQAWAAGAQARLEHYLLLQRLPPHLRAASGPRRAVSGSEIRSEQVPFHPAPASARPPPHYSALDERAQAACHARAAALLARHPPLHAHPQRLLTQLMHYLQATVVPDAAQLAVWTGYTEKSVRQAIKALHAAARAHEREESGRAPS